MGQGSLTTEPSRAQFNVFYSEEVGEDSSELDPEIKASSYGSSLPGYEARPADESSHSYNLICHCLFSMTSMQTPY